MNSIMDQFQNDAPPIGKTEIEVDIEHCWHVGGWPFKEVHFTNDAGDKMWGNFEARPCNNKYKHECDVDKAIPIGKNKGKLILSNLGTEIQKATLEGINGTLELKIFETFTMNSGDSFTVHLIGRETSIQNLNNNFRIITTHKDQEKRKLVEGSFVTKSNFSSDPFQTHSTQLSIKNKIPGSNLYEGYMIGRNQQGGNMKVFGTIRIDKVEKMRNQNSI